MLEHLIEDLAKGLGRWAYLLVGGLALAETAAFLGFIAPGEFTVILGGVLAGEGELSIELLIGIVWACAVAGDSIGFMIGHRFGREFALKYGPRVRLTEDRLKRVEEYFARHGGKTIILGRWLGFVRPLMPFTAGSSGMPYRRFLPYDVVSAGVWTATFCLLGYIFWHSFTTITSIASRGALVFGVLVVLAFVIYQAVKRLRTPEQRRQFAAWVEKQSRKPVLRPFAAVGRALWMVLLRPLWRFVLRPAWLVIAPPIRFTIARLTPGELGIEFTTLLAVAAVSIYTIVLQINLIETGDPLITGDRWAWDLARDIEMGALTALAKVLSFLGSFWVVLVAVLGHGGIPAVPPARGRDGRAGGRVRHQRHRLPRPEGIGRPGAPAGRAGGLGRFGLPVRSRGAGGHLSRDRGAAGALGAGRPADRDLADRPGPGRADRALARLPAGPLAERRGRRLGRWAWPSSRSADASRCSFSMCATT